ncbi:MAG TPA: hypothetical protein PKA64_02330 [Myxococcota bacterium]|nr:hypothetical protein [Myxococcota bacterium]
MMFRTTSSARALITAVTLAAAACTGEPDTDDPVTDPQFEDPCSHASGTICTWLGIPGTAMFSAEDIWRTEAATYLPQDGVFGPDGKFYFIDFNNHRIRAVDPDTNRVSTVSGTGFLGDGPEGPSSDFAFNHPTDLAFHPLDDSKLYVAAWHNSRINVVDLATGETRFECATGGRDFGGDNGPAISALLDLPASIAFEPDGTLFIMDQANQLIRRVDTSDTITTVAGKVETRNIDHDANPDTPNIDKTKGWPGYAGDGGPASEARLWASVGQAADPSSRLTIHDRDLYFVDTENHMVRKVNLDTWQIDHVAGKVEYRENVDHDGNPATPALSTAKGWPGFAGEGTAAVDAVFNGPRDIEIDDAGNMYIADTNNNCVRKIDTDGIITTVAGICGELEAGFSGDDGPATEARLWRPYGIELAADGRLFIADTQNQVFRVVYP